MWLKEIVFPWIYVSRRIIVLYSDKNGVYYVNWSSKVCTLSGSKFVEQESLPSTGRCLCRTALGSMQYHSSWVLWILFSRSQLGGAWNWCAALCRDLYLHAAYIHWWYGASSQEELRVWLSMTVILCIYNNVLISVLETSNDQVVFVFVNWYSSVLKI